MFPRLLPSVVPDQQVYQIQNSNLLNNPSYDSVPIYPVFTPYPIPVPVPYPVFLSRTRIEPNNFQLAVPIQNSAHGIPPPSSHQSYQFCIPQMCTTSIRASQVQKFVSFIKNLYLESNLFISTRNATWFRTKYRNKFYAATTRI